jgi:hypothetical protein
MDFGCFGVLLGALAVAALIIAVNTSKKLTELQRELEAVRRQLERDRAREATNGARVSSPAPPAVEVAEPVPPVPPPAPPPAPPEAPVGTPALHSTPAREIPPEIVEPPPPAPAPPPRPPAPPFLAPTPPPRRRSPAPPRKPFDWEKLVGVNLFSWIAGIALVLAAVFFLKYSVEHGWLSPTVRATLGLITGATLLIVCELRVARSYTTTANAMDAAGIAILYATLFAMHALWALLPGGVVFALMLGVTAVAVLLSIRRDSVFIALLGMMGGFATPALLSTGENRPIGLFSYLLMLNAGLAWVAYKKRWPALTFGSLLFTFAYQWMWIGTFLTAAQLPLAAAIFVVFAIAGSSALWLRGTSTTDGKQTQFDRVSMAASILPLAFAIFGAAVPAYGARYNTLFGFLLFMAAGLALVARFRGPQWLHLLGALTTVLTFAIWSAASYTSRAYPGVLAWIAAFVLLYLASGVGFRTQATSAAAALFFVFTVIAVREPGVASPALLFGTLFVLLTIVALYALRFRAGIIYFIASFFAIVTQAIWSAKHLAPERLLNALLVYGSFALLFVAVPVVARATNRELEPRNGIAATVILSLAVLLFLTTDGIAAAAMWGLAALLTALLAGMFIEARATGRPLLAAVAIVLGWFVLASWWEAAPLVASLIPALFIVGVFGAIVLVGSIWASRSGNADEFGSTAHLAIAGHLFLLYVGASKALAIPPWPLFAVLLLLDLALAAAALYLRRGSLMIGATAASQVVLMFWAGGAEASPWPAVALVAAATIAAFGIAWFAIARRFLTSADTHFRDAAAAGVMLGHLVAISAGVTATRPIFAALLSTHFALLIALLGLTAITRFHKLVVVEVALIALATALAPTSTPGQQLTFAALLYLPFVGYPLLLGRRAERSLHPYLAAALASVPFFFFARNAIVDAGYEYLIGVLPLVQAMLMLTLLVRLLRIEPPGERTLNRLALIAGTSLAFITVAIPLQLEKQWITIGWALEGAALIWLFSRIAHRGLIVWASVLLGAVFIRLVLNPAVFSYQQGSGRPLLNWYLYTYLIAAASFFVGSRLWPRTIARGAGLLASGGTLLLFVLLNIEIADFYSRGRALAFNFFSATLAQELTYTIGWALFAVAMLVAGIGLGSRATRVAALVLLVVTILKCFLHDLARLGGLYRVGSLLGLALSLVAVGLLLQKFVMNKRLAVDGGRG